MFKWLLLFLLGLTVEFVSAIGSLPFGAPICNSYYTCPAGTTCITGGGSMGQCFSQGNCPPGYYSIYSGTGCIHANCYPFPCTQNEYCLSTGSCDTNPCGNNEFTTYGNYCAICPQGQQVTNGACTTTPTCTDGIQNQGETGIDCGGPCPNCQQPTPTCTDGIQNQGETGIDCGGLYCQTCTPPPLIIAEGEIGITQGTMLPYCPPGRTKTDLSCDCSKPYVKNPDNSCTCPNNAISFNGDCVCAAGYSKDTKGTCTSSTTTACGEQMQRDKQGNCACINEEMIRTINGCSYCPAPLHKILQDICVCPGTNLEAQGDGCPFGPDQWRDDTTQIVNCKWGVIGPTPLQCQCPEGQIEYPPQSKTCVDNAQPAQPELNTKETQEQTPTRNCLCPLCVGELSPNCPDIICTKKSEYCDNSIKTATTKGRGSNTGETGTSIWTKAIIESPEQILLAAKDRELTKTERGKLAVSYVGNWIAKAVAYTLDIEGHKIAGVEKIERIIAEQNQLPNETIPQEEEIITKIGVLE